MKGRQKSWPRITRPYELISSGRVQLRSLTQMLAVARLRSFRHAADALGVTQSSISARISSLEHEIGIALFERHARGVRLTDAGARFVGNVTAGLDRLDEAFQVAGAHSVGEAGRLQIGVYALIPGGFLDRLLSRYRSIHPDIQLDLVEGDAARNLSLLRDGQLDIVFMPRVPRLPDLHSRAIWHEELLAVVPDGWKACPASGVLWEELGSEPFLVARGGNGPQAHQIITSRLSEARPDLVVRRLDVERDTVLTLVGRGDGVTIVGDEMTLSPTSGVCYLPILNEPAPISFSAVWSPRTRNPALRILLAMADRAAEVDRSESQAVG